MSRLSYEIHMKDFLMAKVSGQTRWIVNKEMEREIIVKALCLLPLFDKWSMSINNALTTQLQEGHASSDIRKSYQATTKNLITSSLLFVPLPSRRGRFTRFALFCFGVPFTMRLSLFFILFTLLILALAQQQEEEQEREPEREPEPDQEQQDQPLTEGQQAQQRPTGNQQTEEQQSGNQQPSEQQSGGLRNCKATGARPGPNAIVLAPGLSVEFDAESKDITNVTFQAAPGWSPDSLSSCTVRADRELPSSGKKV